MRQTAPAASIWCGKQPVCTVNDERGIQLWLRAHTMRCQWLGIGNHHDVDNDCVGGTMVWRDRLAGKLHTLVVACTDALCVAAHCAVLCVWGAHVNTRMTVVNTKMMAHGCGILGIDFNMTTYNTVSRTWECIHTQPTTLNHTMYNSSGVYDGYDHIDCVRV